MKEQKEFADFRRRLTKVIEAFNESFDAGDCVEDYNTICREWTWAIRDKLDSLDRAAQIEQCGGALIE